MSDDRQGPSTFLHAIPHGWVAARASVGGPNYDEFVDEAEIAAALARRPDSVVALDLPQHTEEARRAGSDFLASLPLAARRLRAMQDAGLYAPVTGGLFAYRMREADGHTVRALVGLVRTDEFSGETGEAGRIIRNEDVFATKVAERRRHIEVLGHLISPVLLLPGGAQERYDSLLAAVFDTLPGPPLVTDTDERGVAHSLWPIDDAGGRIGQVLDRDIYLVADGNHRSLAAQLSGSPWCLVVVASAAGLRIEPYNRVLRLPGMSDADLLARLGAVGVSLVEVPPPATASGSTSATATGSPSDSANHLYLGGGRWFELSWPGLVPDPDAGAAGALPHSMVERHVFGDGLHLEPFAEEIGYVGGRDQRGYLLGEVDAGRATAALLLRAVTVEEFTAINAARQQMPRKSTWFMPKARAGLVLARTGD